MEGTSQEQRDEGDGKKGGDVHRDGADAEAKTQW